MSDYRENQILSKRWLEHMTSCLTWKISGPDINNPFKTPLSYETLLVLSKEREALRHRIQLQCLADGFEVLSVKDYAKLDIQTDHPCLTRLLKSELRMYLTESGVRDQIEEVVDRIHEEICKELERLNQVHSSEGSLSMFKRLKQTTKVKAEAQVRLIKK